MFMMLVPKPKRACVLSTYHPLRPKPYLEQKMHKMSLFVGMCKKSQTLSGLPPLKTK